LACFSFLLAFPGLAGEPTLEGHWEGSITTPAAMLGIDLDFSRGPAGAWTGDISIPAQGAKDLPLADITVEGNRAGFAIPGIPGDPKFDGTFTDEGATLSGDFTQGGQTMPFTMRQGENAAEKARAALEGLDTVIEEALVGFDVPGLAIAIVVEDEVVLSRGFGKRDVEKGLPVTENSLFAIGSCSKAFTTFLLGTLVDEGTLDWDDPVVEHLPEFRLQDDHATRALTVRDLVSHRSGLPRHDLLWYNADFTRSELVERLRHLQPFADLRERYHYQNLMYLTAGYLAERLTGKTWEQGVRERIFNPLGMARSNFNVDESKRDDDHAEPYAEREDELTKIPFRNITTVGPAGSINSSVKEMTAWLRMQLADGKFGDLQLAEPSTIRAMHAPTTLIGGYPTDDEVLMTAYGLGWFLQDYRGYYRVQHGGGIDGFISQVNLVPRERIGIVVLTNRSGGNPLPDLVARTAIDRILGLEPKDWIGEALENKKKADAAGEEAEKKKEETRVTGTEPSHPLEAYAGDYEHEGYGVVRVELADGKLRATFNNITAELEHWHYDVFNAAEGAEDPTFEGSKFLFRGNVKGDIAELVVPMDLVVDPIVFAKLPDRRLSDPEFLGTLTGVYELATNTVTIELRGTTLTATLPGQPQYELLPSRGTEFDIKGLQGFGVVFVLDGSGKVTELQFHQPNGIFTAKPQETEE
jgi:CubicO group peptidase (beta-lactamase class C family)